MDMDLFDGYSNPAKTLHIYDYRLIGSKSNYLVYVAAYDQTTIVIRFYCTSSHLTNKKYAHKRFSLLKY